MKRHSHALVVGKFYPPHVGHHHVIRAAAAGANFVTVVVMAGSQESISLKERCAWLQEEHASDPGISVVGIPCDLPVDYDSSTIWAAQVALMQAAVYQVSPAAIDVVYSSEHYGTELADRLGAQHVLVDPERNSHPVSATAIRADLASHWETLCPATKRGLSTRIIVVGAESTGTTTLSNALAHHFRARGGIWSKTRWISEFGREYSEAKMSLTPSGQIEDVRWNGHDFATIARTQQERENAAASESSPLLVCDTDAVATRVWEKRYLRNSGQSSRASVPAPPTGSRLYLITDHSEVPFHQDGTRDGEHMRTVMTRWFMSELTRSKHSWALLTGSHEDRLALAIELADMRLAARALFADPALDPSGADRLQRM